MWVEDYLDHQLSDRQPSFNIMCNYILGLDHPAFIIETGCIRAEDDYGAGMSTLLWDYMAKELDAFYYSVDISERNVNFAKSLVTFPENIICCDSVLWLYNLKDLHEPVDLLYLDSMDLDKDGDNHASSLHHLFEFLTAKHLLKPNALLVIDDNVDSNKTKAKYIMQYMNEIGIQPLYEGYQMIYSLEKW